MKICIVGPSKRFLSGVSYYTIRLSNALSNHAEVYTLLFRKMLPKRLFPGWRRVGKDLTTLTFKPEVKVYEIFDWYNPLTWLKAWRIAKGCDAMILQWWTSSVAHMHVFVEFVNKISAKVPVIIEFHEVVDPLEDSILPIRVYSRVAGKLVRTLASHYVTHSDADKKLVSKIYGIPEKKITVIPHGLYDHYERVPNAKETLNIGEDFVILFFGLLRPYKGVKYLVKSFESLPREIVENSRLMIVGETWEDKESLKLVEKSHLREKITVVNKYVPDDEVSLYFSASDVLVLPYTRASQSGVAHIAMAFGLPIIATQVGGLYEALKNYSGTYFVKPKDVEALTDALVKVYYQRSKRYLPPQNLKWENVALKWMELLTDLAMKT